MSSGYLLFLVAAVLVYEFINGFHDTGNSIASSVATRALSFQRGVLWSAFFHLAGAATGTSVAFTIGHQLLQAEQINEEVLLATVLMGIIWNLLTWFYGIPSSSSHAMIGSLVGIAFFVSGPEAIYLKGLVVISLGLLTLPFLAAGVGFVFMRLLYFGQRNSTPAAENGKFRKIQVLAAAVLAFAHGSNDAQKSMGILTLALWSGGMISEFMVPFWVKAVCASALALGTAAGGWRIVRTMGQGIVRLEPINGVAADLTAGILIGLAAFLGLPASTTQVVSSTILGIGMAKQRGAVRWSKPLKILWTWWITIPINALGGFLIYSLIL